MAGPNLSGPWHVAVSYAPQGVRVATRAVVTISGDPQGGAQGGVVGGVAGGVVTRIDTLTAALEATYVVARGGRPRVERPRMDGSLTDYRVAVGGAPAAVPAGLSLPRPFSATDSGGAGLGFRVPAEGSACTDPAFSVLQGLHEAWIPLPDTLVMGREWSDTVRTVSCRDRVPLRGVSVRRFRVVRGELQDGRVVVMIERRAKGQVAGSGDQFGERVELDGSSSGTVLYALDASSGRLLRAAGTSLVELRFKSRRRNQRVRQESELSFVFRP
ncbi:MAG: hypothetical protein NTW72_12905 [Gemmatimonadetes bacterium]|nr:hypothetical protein [Gemmatimonadota bacterium]